jgi:hypothetical protein
LNLVNHLANAAMDNAVANGLMQHPEISQDSHSISSDTKAFLKAEGPPVTLELPLPTGPNASRIILVRDQNSIHFDDDAAVRRLAARFGLHQCFGSTPSMPMLIQELAMHAQAIPATAPMKEPLPVQSWNFVLASSFTDTWFLSVDNPNWGNNAEGSTSSGIKRPRLQLIQPSLPEPEDEANPSNNSEHNSGALVLYSQVSASNQPISSVYDQMQESSNNMVVDMELDGPSPLEVVSTPNCVKKRKGHGQTPIVDDEVHRSARLRKDVLQDHIQLDNEPRRKKDAPRKSVSFSSVADLKKAIISNTLEDGLAEFEVGLVHPLLLTLALRFVVLLLRS